MNSEKHIVSLSKLVVRMALLVLASLILVLFMYCSGYKGFVFDFYVTETIESSTETTNEDYFARDFNISELGSSLMDSTIRLGYEIVTNTSQYIGPLCLDIEKRFAGNNLNCQNCHLNAGTKPFSAPFVGVISRFPQYRGRENTIGSIEERINGCMERSMNGKKMPDNSPEMRAIVSYMNWLSKDVPTGKKIVGSGFKKIVIPDRMVDLKNGEIVFKKQCVICHADDGKGQLMVESNIYQYPPLAGDDSYNHGAGMHRVITAAQFIKSNMPLGSTAESSILSDEDAYDVAGFINSLDRPFKRNTQIDFPDLKRKPMSTPYGPYVDDFSLEQHKYGPFQEIKNWYFDNYSMLKSK